MTHALDGIPSSVARIRVKPRHCDAQAMVHAIRYYAYFEDAFLEWLDRFAGGYAGLREDGVDMVIVANGCQYRGSARLDDMLAVEARPSAVGRTSLSMTFDVRRDDTAIVTGHATYVAVRDGEGVALPERLRTVLRHVPQRERRSQ
ncbi:acyl-CoA thioesterase [Actinomadura rudentiformis]|uniref:Acyl-CoA thioesterase n=1 Tax=Actinomadura rudentiformis TaxID=359158 RepID=A0A6H9YV05_9ACTN|nr:thioesterase family protein [Actinomadura rudentiformis]KAB2344450.1 acyl-CoA thioesterase [Actinomadura rudentiformis]